MKSARVQISGHGRSDAVIYGSAILGMLVLGIMLLVSGVGKYPYLLGLAVVSYTLGLGHAFDVDHISAIDNIIRKLAQQQKNPRGVGFFFSCGHSAVVILMATATIFAVKWAQTRFSVVQGFTGPLASALAGGFLLLIALVNFIVLKDTVKTFRRVKRGQYEPEDPDAQASGVLGRGIKFLLGLISSSWQVLGVGFLFGLGFDTATQIGVLATTATASSQSVPWYAVLSFPILFTAGMSMMDTLDGFFMSAAYNWVFRSPLRKLYYNLVITGLSVLAAGVVGIIEIAQAASKAFGLDSGMWLWMQALNFRDLGFILVGIFVVVFGFSLAGWKLLGVSEHGEDPA